LEGICVLLEKEWNSFGHKFQDRCGHLSKQAEPKSSNASNSIKDYLGTFGGGMTKLFAQTKPTSLASSESISQNSLQPKEISPVFVQFLDCLYQIWVQSPTSFEFDESLLLFLFVACYSCEFGNFLFNNEKETREFLYRKRGSFGSTIQESTCSIWQHIHANRDRFSNPLYRENTAIIKPSTMNLVYWSRGYHVSSTWKEDIKEHLDPRIPTLPGVPLSVKPSNTSGSTADPALPEVQDLQDQAVHEPSIAEDGFSPTQLSVISRQSVFPDPFSPTTSTNAIQMIPKKEFVDPLSAMEVVDLQGTSKVPSSLTKNPWA
jgi:hypothetical protein